MRRIFTILVLFGFLSLNIAAQVPSKGPPGWTQILYSELLGTGNASSCPSPFPPGVTDTSGCGALITAWDSAAADTNRNRMLLWGGGHADYPGNEVYSIDLTQVGLCTAINPCIKRLNSFSPPNTVLSRGNVTCQEALPTGFADFTPGEAPNARHPYDGLAFIPTIDAMFITDGSLNACGFAGNGTWTLPMSTVPQSCAVVGSSAVGCSSLWTRLPNNPSSNLGSMSAFDPVHNVLWVNTESSLEYFSFVTNTWKTVNTSYVENVYGTGVYDDYDQYFINFGYDVALQGKGVAYFNVATLAGSAPTFPGVDASCTAANTGYPGLAWDPIDRKVVIYIGKGNVIYLLDPHTWKCTTETYGSVQTVDYPQNTAANACSATGQCTFKRFSYFPKLDILLLVNDYANNAWYLRRRRGNGQVKH